MYVCVSVSMHLDRWIFVCCSVCFSLLVFGHMRVCVHKYLTPLYAESVCVCVFFCMYVGLCVCVCVYRCCVCPVVYGVWTGGKCVCGCMCMYVRLRLGLVFGFGVTVRVRVGVRVRV